MEKCFDIFFSQTLFEIFKYTLLPFNMLLIHTILFYIYNLIQTPKREIVSLTQIKDYWTMYKKKTFFIN